LYSVHTETYQIKDQLKQAQRAAREAREQYNEQICAQFASEIVEQIKIMRSQLEIGRDPESVDQALQGQIRWMAQRLINAALNAQEELS